MSQKRKILMISSYVASGQVGLQAAQPALRALDVAVVSLPTTLLAAHPAAFPDAGLPAGGAVPPEQLRAMGDWLLKAGALDGCDAVLTGYMPSAAHIEVTADLIRRLKQKRPDMTVCCDPICGDMYGEHGRLYVPQAVVEGLRDILLPLAEIATPNLFELQTLSGAPCDDTAMTVAAARQLNRKQLIVTSAPAPEGRIATLKIDAQTTRCETARAPHAPHGMGDFFAALYLGLNLKNEPKALGISCATLAARIAHQGNPDELPHGPVTLAPAALSDKVAE